MNFKFSRSFLAVIAGTCLATAAMALPVIDKTVNVNVYQLCDNAGNNCASKGPVGNEYYADSTNKIWAQAGISVTFTFVSQIFSTAFLDLDDVPGDDFGALHAGYGTLGPSNSFVDMFLVNSFDGAYGVGWSGEGGLVMSMSDILGFNCGGALPCTGRIDTLAHELGHNFGLVPVAFDDYAGAADPGHSDDPNNLMAGGGIRNVPTTLADIGPDGLGLDFLPDTHIALARQSSLLRDIAPSNNVPEPSSLALVGLALVGLGLRRRRQSAA